MLRTHTYPRYEYRRPPELGGPSIRPRRMPVVIVGAGPVGLVAAIDLARRGQPVLLLDEDDTVSVGSRAVCYAKRTLEILDRLGVGDAVTTHGVPWHLGRTFFGEGEVFRFDLLPESDHRRPAMVNLQQYHFEEHLVHAAARTEGLDLRWKHRVAAVAVRDDHTLLTVETPDGYYQLAADWLIIADGARSGLRRMLGLEVEGRVFDDRFLIADVVMKAEFAAERWFWFDPPFHRGQSVLLHKQADDVWRIDFQLGRDADPELEKQPDRVVARVRSMLGPDRPFELEWVSVYTFQCRRMENFRHGRLLFVGDCAHQVSPFGARGANSGIQDVDNLVWKLDLVIRGKAPAVLLDSYDDERTFAADENILNSTRATEFITPKNAASLALRDATLSLAPTLPFARTLVNSGRLSVPAFLTRSELNMPDRDPFRGRMMPGAPADDAPVAGSRGEQWLLEALGGHFVAMVFISDLDTVSPAVAEAIAALAADEIPIDVVLVTDLPSKMKDARVLVDSKGVATRRYDARDGTTYVIRPDQHVCARYRRFEPSRIRRAVRRATAQAVGDV